jgi:hypothetical protein
VAFFLCKDKTPVSGDKLGEIVFGDYFGGALACDDTVEEEEAVGANEVGACRW